MKAKILWAPALAVLLAVASGVLYAQEAPEPPEPPPSPEDPQIFLFNDGSAHLGVNLGDVSAAKAQELKLPAVAGAIVKSVQPGSAAAKAGLETGDAIVEFDGIRVRSAEELRRLIRETPVDRTVAIKVVRDGKTSILTAKLAAGENRFEFSSPQIRIPDIHPNPSVPLWLWPGEGARLGISGNSLTPQLAEFFGVKQGKGVLISEVTKGGAADKAGLKAGDVIVAVNGKEVGSTDALRDAVNSDWTGDTAKVHLTIVRDRHEQTVEAELHRSQPPMNYSTSIGDVSLDALDPNYRRDLAQLQEQASQLRALAANERAQVLSDEQKQQQLMRGEWQRQLQEQMKSIEDQLQQLQKLRIRAAADGEI